MQAQANLMNSTNYTKAHEAKNRGQHIQAVGYLKMAAIDLGLALNWSLGLDWTGDAMADWDNNIAAVDAAWKRKDSPWKLLHEEEPKDGEQCYWGFVRRDGSVALDESTVWSEDCEDWLNGEESEWGYVRPANLPIDIYWCNSADFPSRKEARESLKSLLGVS